MKAFIIRWNPNNSLLTTDKFKELTNIFKDNCGIHIDWLINDNLEITRGDFFILLECGTSNDGVVAYGHFVTPPYTVYYDDDGEDSATYADLEIFFLIDRTNPDAPLKKSNFESFPQISWDDTRPIEMLESSLIEPLVVNMFSYLLPYRAPYNGLFFNNLSEFQRILCGYIKICAPKTHLSVVEAGLPQFLSKLPPGVSIIDNQKLHLSCNNEALKELKEDQPVSPVNFKKFLFTTL